MMVNAQAAFRAVETFDSLNLADVNGQNGWDSDPGSAEVVRDPSGGGNQVLEVLTESGELFKAAKVAAGTTRMLFLRLRFEEHGRYSFGLSFASNPTEYIDFQPELGMAAATTSDPGNDLRVANGLGTEIYDELKKLVPGIWYNVWVLVNNDTETYEVWLNSNPGGSATASNKLSNSAGDTLFGFRKTPGTDLKNFFIKTGGGSSPVNGRFYIDDIYLENTGSTNLNNPTSGDTDPVPTEPEPTDPVPTEPEPTDPVPMEPEPTDPVPTEPEPTDPVPTEPEPTDPVPTEPEPTDPDPTDDPPSDTASVAAASLPSSRSVQLGSLASAFATMINTSSTAANDCSIAPQTSVAADFTYQTTDASNVLVGTPDTPADIAAGESQNFIFGFSPTSPISPTEVLISYDCTNSAPATITVGLNTLLLSASASPIPDIVALVATPTGDGILNLPGPNGSNAFAVSAVNVGSADTITATPSPSVVLPLAMSICQTDATGACLSSANSSATGLVEAGATPTYSVFVTATATVPFDPANNRIVVEFTDSGGVVRGSTSVAVTTQ
jgi:hypothetical protein